MLRLIDFKLKQVYQEKNGKRKVGFSKRILLDGFSGIVDFQMEEDFQKWMKFKLKDGKILQGMSKQLKKTVMKEI